MQETLKYEKPSIKFVSLRANKNVADPCWSPNSYQDVELYYDIPGKGYVKFKAQGNGNNCGSAKITILEYYNTTAADVNQDKLIGQVIEACGGGNSGNPYKGNGDTVAPDPGPSWS